MHYRWLDWQDNSQFFTCLTRLRTLVGGVSEKRGLGAAGLAAVANSTDLEKGGGGLRNSREGCNVQSTLLDADDCGSCSGCPYSRLLAAALCGAMPGMSEGGSILRRPWPSTVCGCTVVVEVACGSPLAERGMPWKEPPLGEPSAPASAEPSIPQLVVVWESFSVCFSSNGASLPVLRVFFSRLLSLCYMLHIFLRKRRLHLRSVGGVAS